MQRNSTFRSLLAGLLATASLTSDVLAQLTPYTGVEIERREWPSSVPKFATLGRTIEGRITGNGCADLVVLDGTRAILITAPGIHRSIEVLPMAGADQTVHDAVIARAAVHAGQDALLMVGPSGLRSWRFHSEQETSAPTPSLLMAGAWQNACAVRVAVGSPGLRVYGVTGDRSKLLWADLDLAATQVLASGSLVSAAPILALETIEWNGDGLEDVAIVTTAGLRVLGRSGITLVDLVPPGPLAWQTATAYLTRIRNGTSPQTLAIAVPKPEALGAGYYLFVLGSDRFEVADIGTFTVRGLASGDAITDGYDDLVIAGSTNDVVYGLPNLRGPHPTSPTTFSFTPGFAFTLSIAGSNTTPCENFAQPVVTDFDSDGDFDILVPVETGVGGNRALLVARHTLITTPPPVTITAGGFHQEVTMGGLTGLQTQLDLAWQPLPQATHVEVVVWKEMANKGGIVRVSCCHLYLSATTTVKSLVLHLDPQFAVADGTFEVLVRPVVAAQQKVVAVGQAFTAKLWFEAGPNQVANTVGLESLPALELSFLMEPPSRDLPHGPASPLWFGDPIKVGGIIITPGITNPGSGTTPPAPGASSNQPG